MADGLAGEAIGNLDSLLAAGSFGPATAGAWLVVYGTFLKSAKTQEDKNSVYKDIFAKTDGVATLQVGSAK